MKKNEASKLIKILIIINISLNIYNHTFAIIKDKKYIEYYISYSICKLLRFKVDYFCINNILNDSNFYEEKVDIISNVNLFINIKKTKIENLLLLIVLLPFLKNNSILLYKINDREIYKLFRIIFKDKKIQNKIIEINEYDIINIIEKFIDLLYYKWEFIPNKKILIIIRYIINNFFNESCLAIFDKSLNFNFKNFIQNKINIFSLEEISELMSKIHYFFIYYNSFFI